MTDLEQNELMKCPSCAGEVLEVKAVCTYYASHNHELHDRWVFCSEECYSEGFPIPLQDLGYLNYQVQIKFSPGYNPDSGYKPYTACS